MALCLSAMMAESLVGELQIFDGQPALYTLCLPLASFFNVLPVGSQGDGGRILKSSGIFFEDPELFGLLSIIILVDLFWWGCVFHCYYRHYKIRQYKTTPKHGKCTFFCCAGCGIPCVLCYPIDPWWWPFDGPEDVGIPINDIKMVGRPVKAAAAPRWAESAKAHELRKPAFVIEKQYSLDAARRVHARNKELADTIQMPSGNARFGLPDPVDTADVSFVGHEAGSLPGGNLPNQISRQ
eukprot:TRINITY_DN61072_c0_g1_i1.p1 TRINITY_DN61072_c0_g1~~TRINITY_DN61072_c0_g1_i1.p1  ORF type:complete len:239 (-),score=22.07 TRINITY_DN61072_c0_g1_i1:26-742(-)